VFEAGKWNRLADIRDGSAVTLLVVEVTGGNSHWMEPIDLDASALKQMLNTARDGTGLASKHAGGVNVAMADGTVIALKDAIDLKSLQRLVTKSDGQTVVLP
jgi:prepilin-type processing-associated H-X9-DG protein